MEKSFTPSGKSAGTMTGLCLWVCLFFCQGAWAANFDIQPIRIFLDEKVKLEKLIIKNVSDVEFPLQIKVFEWSQNEKGEDVYSETKDIITFPKMLTIKTGEERFIRIAAKVPQGNREKTYRIYVEEMPAPVSGDEEQGATVNLFMKIGIPVFINPTKIEANADIEGIEMTNGLLKIKVRNTGNKHFIVTGINIRGEKNDGKEPFSRDIGGWYLLNGSAKVYETFIPQEICGSLTTLSVALKTNQTTVKKDIPIDMTMCGQREIASCGKEGKAACQQIGLAHGF
jgi:fimbrial chaperone protein